MQSLALDQKSRYARMRERMRFFDMVLLRCCRNGIIGERYLKGGGFFFEEKKRLSDLTVIGGPDLHTASLQTVICLVRVSYNFGGRTDGRCRTYYLLHWLYCAAGSIHVVREGSLKPSRLSVPRSLHGCSVKLGDIEDFRES